MALPEVNDPPAALPQPTAVLLVGFGVAELQALAPRLADLEVRVAADVGGMLASLAAAPVAVVCLGAGVAGEAARVALAEVLERFPDQRRAHLVLAAGAELDRFQDFIDADQLYYLSREPLPAGELAALLRSAAGRHRLAGAGAVPERSQLERGLHYAQRLAAETQPAGAAALVAQAIEELLAAQAGELLLYDPKSDTLWSPGRGGEEQRESAAAGLVSFVVRTGQALARSPVADDPRYDAEADNPAGRGDEHFLAVAVQGPSDGAATAVLVARRHAARPPFGAAEQRALEVLAAQLSAPVEAFALRARRQPEEGLFRQEALEHYLSGLRDQGDLLRVSPSWTAWTYWLLLAVLLAALLYSLFGRINEYAAGPAVVRAGGRTELTAPSAGTVTTVEVKPGERVDAGQLLVTFYDAQELGELERIRRESELQLLNRLRNPADPTAERALIALKAQEELAQARLDERALRAPQAGVVSDLRVRPGQYVLPGQILVALRGPAPELTIVALLPGHVRPQLRAGMPLRLELQGYRYSYQHLVVDTVSDEVLGPTEARRALGPEIAESLPLTGPVVFVQARLPGPSFESDGKVYEYHDGMYGTAEARVRSERILLTLVPGLKALRPDREEP